MRMSGLCKVEMSAFMVGRGPHGNGAHRLEPTRTGPIESVARGKAKASDAGSCSQAVESNRPPGAADAAPHSRARVSPQNENVRFVQSRNVRFHGWPRAPWKRSASP